MATTEPRPTPSTPRPVNPPMEVDGAIAPPSSFRPPPDEALTERIDIPAGLAAPPAAPPPTDGLAVGARPRVAEPEQDERDEEEEAEPAGRAAEAEPVGRAAEADSRVAEPVEAETARGSEPSDAEAPDEDEAAEDEAAEDEAAAPTAAAAGAPSGEGLPAIPDP